MSTSTQGDLAIFVTSTRKYIDPDNLMIGHEYEIDSGMGGSYVVRYEGVRSLVHKFSRVYRKGTEPGPQHTYSVKFNEISTTIFIVVPENPVYRKMDDAERLAVGIRPDHEKRCKACREMGRVFIELIGPNGDVATVVCNATDNNHPQGIYTPCNSARPKSERRAALYSTCIAVNEFVGKSLGWQQTEDQMKWVCPTHNILAAHNALELLGYKAHGEEAEWLKTGKWPV